VALAELVTAVMDELRYASTVLAQEKEIKRAISLAYQELAEERAWSWLNKTTTLWMIPDLTVANGDLTRLNDRSFAVTQGVIRAAIGTEDALLGIDEFDFHRMSLTGAEFDLADLTKRSLGSGVWGRAPFEVEYVRGTGVGTQEQFWLDPRCRIAAITGNEGSFSFRFPRYRLPADCSRVERIHHWADRVPLTALDEESGAMLRPTTGSRPTHFWMDTVGLQPRRVPNDYPILALDEQDNAAMNDDAFGRRNRAPADHLWSVSSPNGIVDTTKFPNGQYEIGIAWWYGNRWSPMSVKSLEVDHSEGYGNIETAMLPTMMTGGVASEQYGRRLATFASYEGGPFYLIAQNGTAAFTGGAITQNPLVLHNPGTWRRHDEMYPPEGYQYVRVWPRPEVLTRFEVKYIARPRNLLGDGDVPELPTNHDVIVYRAALRLMNRNDQGDAFVRTLRLERQAYARMCRRYGVEPHLRSTRGMIDDPAGLSSWPTPNLNYNGDV
jgi:hypothetical protein